MKILYLIPCLASLMKGVHADTTTLFSDMYVFGDSLSDQGNTASVIPGFANTNGYTAIKYVALTLGLPLEASLHLVQPVPVGNNFAVSGAYAVAESNDDFTPDFFNLPTQVNAFLAWKELQIDPDALYYFSIGGNDVLRAGDIIENTYGTFNITTPSNKSGKKSGKKGVSRKLGKGSPSGGKKSSKNNLDFLEEYLAAAYVSVTAAVDSQIAEIAKLASLGGTKFFIQTLGDTADVPSNTLKAAYFIENAVTEQEEILGNQMLNINTGLAMMYSTYLTEQVEAVLRPQFPDATFAVYDFFTALKEQEAMGGFTYMTEPCLLLYPNPAYDVPYQNANCVLPAMDGFFFFDDYHPTTLAHLDASLLMFDFMVEQFS